MFLPLFFLQSRVSQQQLIPPILLFSQTHYHFPCLFFSLAFAKVLLHVQYRAWLLHVMFASAVPWPSCHLTFGQTPVQRGKTDMTGYMHYKHQNYIFRSANLAHWSKQVLIKCSWFLQIQSQFQTVILRNSVTFSHLHMWLEWRVSI